MAIKDYYQIGFSKGDTISDTPRLLTSLKMAKKFVKAKNPVILDIGCGDGYFTKLLGQTLGSTNLNGVDISNNAKELAVENGVDFHLYDIDEGKLSFDDEKFDFIYCGCLIELVLDPDHLLEEINRLLKTDGIVILNNPNMNSWASRIAFLFGYLPYYGRVSTKFDLGKLGLPVSNGTSSGFIRLFPTKVLKQFLTLHNFNVRALAGASDNSIPSILKPIDNFFTVFPSLSFQNVWVLKKRT